MESQELPAGIVLPRGSSPRTPAQFGVLQSRYDSLSGFGASAARACGRLVSLHHS